MKETLTSLQAAVLEVMYICKAVGLEEMTSKQITAGVKAYEIALRKRGIEI